MTDRDPDRLEFIRQIPDWIKGFIAFFLVVIGFVNLWKDNTHLTIIVLLIIILVGGWLGCFYLAFKRTDSRIVGGRRVLKYPQWRFWTIMGLFVIPLLMVGILTKQLIFNESEILPLPCSEAKLCIVIADFGETANYKPSDRSKEISLFTSKALTNRLESTGQSNIAQVQRIEEIIKSKKKTKELNNKKNISITVWGFMPAEASSYFSPNISVWKYRNLVKQTRFDDLPLTGEKLDTQALGEQLADRIMILINFVQGLSFSDEGKYAQAYDSFTNAIQIAEKSSLYFEEGTPDKKNFDKGLAVLYLYRGRTAQERKNLTFAAKDFEAALKLYPQYSEAHVGLGNNFYLHRNMELAFQEYQEALNHDKCNEGALTGLGNIFFYREKYSQSLEQFEEAIDCSRDKDYPLPYLGMAYVYQHQGEVDKSTQAFNRYCELTKSVSKTQAKICEREIESENKQFKDTQTRKQQESTNLALLTSFEVGEQKIEQEKISSEEESPGEEIEEESSEEEGYNLPPSPRSRRRLLPIPPPGGYLEEETEEEFPFIYAEEEEEEEDAPNKSDPKLDLDIARQKLAALKNRLNFIPESVDLMNFKKISSHEHFYAKGDIAAYLRAMDILGISKVVLLPTGLPPDNQGYKENMDELLEIQKHYPDKIVAFCTIDEQASDAVEILEDCASKGGRGLKLIGWHPKFFDEPFGESINSPRMYKVYEKAKDLEFPVLIHINMREHPKWQQQFEETLQDFPNLTFIAAHYCKHSPDIENCGVLLDKYPNLFADISMGGRLRTYLREISNDPEKFRDFIISHQDKLLWGVDMIIRSPDMGVDTFINRTMYDITLLETGQYQSALHSLLKNIPAEVYDVEDVQLFGLDLPDNVLRKLYFENPQKVFRMNLN